MSKPYYADGTVALHLGDCRDVLATLADASVDAVVCDPPYEINFLSKGWDSTGIAYDVNVWRQCLRVLKPGGHLLAFGATRTYHRLTIAIEDAGFEIRDSIHWIYGNGFPKGQDIGKRIDKMRDDRAEILAVTAFLAAARDAAGLANKDIDVAFGFNGMARHWTTSGMTAQVPNVQTWERLRSIIGFDSTMDAEVLRLNQRKGTIGDAWNRREVIGHRHAGLGEGGSSVFLTPSVHAAADGLIPVTKPATDAAKAWDGWNTALKPAHEPIVVARKTTGFNSTVANVLLHGTGALNVDACRIPANDPAYARNAAGDRAQNRTRQLDMRQTAGHAHEGGRWPTNIVLSHDADCGDMCVDGCPVADLNGDGAHYFPAFRYQAKASAAERPRLGDDTTHATVKPLDLMRWLVRLIAPPGGTVLDPFAGSGTTLESCVIEGFHAIGIEQDRKHAELCVARLSKPIQPTLDGAA